MEELRLALLGDLQVTRGGTSVSGFVSAKVPALFCYLAVTGRPHFRQALAGLLWGGWPEAEALASLRKALHNLRRLAGIHLVVAGHTIAFDRSSPYWLDVEVFQDEVQKYSNGRVLSSPAQVAALSEAVELYRGDFLEGFHVRDAIEFEEWMASQRERLRLLAGRALELLAAYHVQQAQYGEAIGYVRRLLALAPWQEETHRQLMWLLARAGQRSAALAQYDVCRQALATELGVEPSDETIVLYRRIRAAGAPRPNNLPAPVTSFLGRQRELEQIGHLLDGEARLLTLIGPGGVGKTRLALEAAARAARDAAGAFSDGIYFVSLAPLPSVDLVAPAIAGALGFSAEGGVDLPARVLEELRQKDLLLLLDSFEPVMEAAPFVGELLAACPGLKVMVTSREPLNLRGERRVPVPPLAVPDRPAAGRAASLDGTFEPERYLCAPAIALFVDRAQAVQPGFALDQESGDVVADICTRLDGLPLAIELAAARCGEIPLAAMQGQLSNRLSLLTGGARDLPMRQQTLRDTIDWSVRLLPAGEQHLLTRLAVFAGGCTPDAVDAVSGLPVETNSRLLQSLVNKNLLKRREVPAGGTRFFLLDTVREYASEQLAARGETEAAGAAHAAYYLAVAERAEPELRGSQQPAWLNRLEAEQNNLRAVLQWALDRENAELAGRMAAALGMFWSLQSHLSEGRRWLEATLSIYDLRLTIDDRAVTGQPSIVNLKSKILTWLSTLETLAGDLEAARARAEEALGLKRLLGDRAGVASQLSWLGRIANSQGDHDRARGHFEESLALARQLDPPAYSTIAFAVNALGNLAADRGDLPAAVSFYEQSLAAWQALGRQDGIICALANLGHVVHARADDARAEALLREGLVLAAESTDRKHIAYILRGLAAVAGTRSDAARAARLFGHAEALIEEIDYSFSVTDVARYEQDVAAVRRQMEVAAFAAAWAEGRAMALAEAVAFAQAG